MKRQGGYTIIEVMIVIAIMSILAATAIPTYSTWRQRAIAAEAKMMVKQIMDAEIGYYLDHNTFFPEDSDSLEVYNNYPQDHDNVKNISRYLHVEILTGHYLDYTFQLVRSDPLAHTFQLEIWSSTNSTIFGDSNVIIYTLDNKGIISEGSSL
jgi:prepilin-type N-terminal cleavage/methylation domain-containing protein